MSEVVPVLTFVAGALFGLSVAIYILSGRYRRVSHWQPPIWSSETTTTTETFRYPTCFGSKPGPQQQAENCCYDCPVEFMCIRSAVRP